MMTATTNLKLNGNQNPGDRLLTKITSTEGMIRNAEERRENRSPLQFFTDFVGGPSLPRRENLDSAKRYLKNAKDFLARGEFGQAKQFEHLAYEAVQEEFGNYSDYQKESFDHGETAAKVTMASGASLFAIGVTGALALSGLPGATALAGKGWGAAFLGWGTLVAGGGAGLSLASVGKRSLYSLVGGEEAPLDNQLMMKDFREGANLASFNFFAPYAGALGQSWGQAYQGLSKELIQLVPFSLLQAGHGAAQAVSEGGNAGETAMAAGLGALLPFAFHRMERVFSVPGALQNYLNRPKGIRLYDGIRAAQGTPVEEVIQLAQEKFRLSAGEVKNPQIINSRYREQARKYHSDVGNGFTDNLIALNALRNILLRDVCGVSIPEAQGKLADAYLEGKIQIKTTAVEASSPSSTSSNIEVEDVSNLPPWMQKDRIVTAIQEMEIKNGGIAERPWREDPFYDIAEAQSEGVPNDPMRQDAAPLQPQWKIGTNVTPQNEKLASERLGRKGEPSSAPAQSSIAAVLQVPTQSETSPGSQVNGIGYFVAGDKSYWMEENGRGEGKSDFMGNNQASNRRVKIILDLVQKGLREKNLDLPLDLKEIREKIHHGEMGFYKENGSLRKNGDAPRTSFQEIAEKIIQDLSGSHEAQRQMGLRNPEVEQAIVAQLNLREAVTQECDAMIAEIFSDRRSPISMESPLALPIREWFRSRFLKELEQLNPSPASLEDLRSLGFFAGKKSEMLKFIVEAKKDPSTLLRFANSNSEMDQDSYYDVVSTDPQKPYGGFLRPLEMDQPLPSMGQIWEVKSVEGDQIHLVNGQKSLKGEVTKQIDGEKSFRIAKGKSGTVQLKAGDKVSFLPAIRGGSGGEPPKPGVGEDGPKGKVMEWIKRWMGIEYTQPKKTANKENVELSHPYRSPGKTEGETVSDEHLQRSSPREDDLLTAILWEAKILGQKNLFPLKPLINGLRKFQDLAGWGGVRAKDEIIEENFISSRDHVLKLFQSEKERLATMIDLEPQGSNRKRLERALGFLEVEQYHLPQPMGWAIMGNQTAQAWHLVFKENPFSGEELAMVREYLGLKESSPDFRRYQTQINHLNQMEHKKSALTKTIQAELKAENFNKAKGLLEESERLQQREKQLHGEIAESQDRLRGFQPFDVVEKMGIPKSVPGTQERH